MNELTVTDVLGEGFNSDIAPAHTMAAQGKLEAFKRGFFSSGKCETEFRIRVEPEVVGESFRFTMTWEKDGRKAALDMVCSRFDTPFRVGAKAREHFDKFMSEAAA